MDPRLQRAIVNQRSGKEPLPLASAAENEVAVVARVTDERAWREMPDVHFGVTLGAALDGSMLVTGRIRIERIEAVHAEKNVLSLNASQSVAPTLEATTRIMKVGKLVRTDVQPAGGKNVVIGIIDTGGDFAHLNFRDRNGRTRLLALWDQNGIARAGDRVSYGRCYMRAEIDAALAQPDPYATLGYGPRPDSRIAPTECHGTHVMDIAAGNGLGTGIPGVAPEADLVFVEVSTADVPRGGPEVVGTSLGDSVQMLEAVQFVFDLAGDRPCVVNISLGTYGGPHDGTSLLEQSLDAMAREKPNRAVVIAAGNAQDRGLHSSGTIPAEESLELQWRVGRSGGEFELWSEPDTFLQLKLTAPDGTVVATLTPGTNQTLEDALGNPVIFLSSRLSDPNNQCNMIGIWLAPDVPGGNWRIDLESLSRKAVQYHAWIERQDSSQSSFVNPVDSHSLASISTGHESIAVGSFDAHKTTFPVSSFSAAGPTRDGRPKPEISAPGANVSAAWSWTRDGLTRKSGTSMAAPAISGLVALMLAEAQRRGKTLKISEIRAQLMANAEKSPPCSNGWHPQYGYGRGCSTAI
jgi:subtilisin family serine protease